MRNLFLPSTGITRVSLIVSTSEMEFSVFTLVINVTLYSPPPVANFTWVPQFNINVSTVVEFYDLSTDDGILVWWAWSFGDGYNSNDQNPVHQYLAPGTYTVLLSVYDNSSKQDYIQYNITVVNLVPVASFVWTPTIASTGEDVYFSDTSTDDEMAIVAWQWYFGDGTNSTLQHPVHVYMADGVFNVTLTVWDVHGANDSWSAIVTVSTNVAPTADFDWSPGTIDIDTTVTFNDLSVDSDGWIASWYWFFGDGADSYVQNATHKYNWPGTFTVTLSVWDNNGTSSLISKNLSVFNYAPEVTCLNGSIVSIMNGTSNNTLHFLLTDKESGTGMYSVYIDGSYVDANSFVNGSIIVVPIDGLLPGAHEVNMTNNDGYTFTSDIVFVQVNLPTNIPPVISCLNGTNVVIQGNTTGNLLFFQVHDEDNTTGFFLVEINGTPAGSGSWNNVTLTPIQIDGLDAGNWTVNFTATDGSNSTSFFVSVEVLANPNVPPVVECVFGPTFTFQNGTTSNYIQLVVTDTGSASGTFVAYIDNVACDSGPWINITAVNINLDFLSPGIYEFNLTASDGDLEGSVLVTVNVTSPPPNTPPSVASWDGLSIEFQNGTTGNVLRFVVTDAQSLSGLYTIDMNLSAYDSGSWDNDTFVYVNLDSLAPGTYQLNFTASDGELFGYVFVFVNVTSPPPNTPPTVTSLDGLSVEFQNGTNGNIFQFIVTDTQTGSGPFTVTINTSAYDAGTWTNDTALDVNLDSLSPGTYQLNFTASDGELFGYVFVFVNVTSPPPNTPPSIDCINGSSVTIEYGSIDNVLRFNVTDAQSSTGTYSVFIGITPWGSGSWTNASLVNVDIDGLLAGTHTLNFTANDTVLTSSMYVSITVNPPANMAPVVTVVNGTTIEFIEGTPSVYIGFIVQDDNDPSGNYEIRFSNETVYDIGTWTNNSLHLVLLGPSLSGTFAFNVIGFDSGGLNHTKVVTVTVLGTPSNTAPTVNISTPLITYQVGTKNHSVSFVVTDNENSTGTYTVRLANGSVIAGGTWINETVTNASVDGLPIGTHVIDIIVSDGVLEETLNVTVIVTPVPNAPPTAFFTYATPNPAITIVYAKIPITFTDGSTDPDGEEDIVEWFWDFGTNLTSNQKNPGSIAFPTNGTFTIRLTVVDSAGNNDTYEMEINVLPLPDEDIPGYAPGLVMFIAMAMIAGVIAGIKKKYNRA